MAGYSEEKMMEVFHDILQSIGSNLLCPIAGSFSKKKNIEDFHELYSRLNEVEQMTRDLS